MTLTLAQARDAVISLVDAAWKADATTLSFPMLYDDVKGDNPGENASTTQATAFGRTTLRTLTSPQSTQGRRRFLTTAALTVQIFTPFGDGHTLGDPMAKVVLDALRGHVGSTGGFWLSDIAANEIGQDGPWFQTNVVATARYQENAS